MVKGGCFIKHFSHMRHIEAAVPRRARDGSNHGTVVHEPGAWAWPLRAQYSKTRLTRTLRASPHSTNPLVANFKLNLHPTYVA